MNKTNLTEEASDRLAIRELIDAYAYDADGRLAQEQAALFTEDAVTEVYPGEPGKIEPVQVLRGRAALASGFAEGLKKYDVTTHFNGQSRASI